MINWKDIAAAINKATKSNFELARTTPLTGGSINQAWHMKGREGVQFFVKLNDARKLPMFAEEEAGLEALAASLTMRVPRAVTCGCSGEHAFLVLEYLDLKSSGDARLLGQQLAELHRVQAPRFGWKMDNTLGETLQKNAWNDGWIDFWREQRLGFQLDLAASNGYDGELQNLGRKLMGRLPEYFSNYQPIPSLLHGDLWGGNHAYTKGGTPVLFDPAPYFGDREADLAMTELFGGFSQEFYTSYNAAWPLDAGYALRKTLYNLYHILNHANLFGGGYATQAEAMMIRLMNQEA